MPVASCGPSFHGHFDKESEGNQHFRLVISVVDLGSFVRYRTQTWHELTAAVENRENRILQINKFNVWLGITADPPLSIS